MKEWLRKRCQGWGRDRMIRWLVAAGIAGMLLIALSECWPRRTATDTATALTVTAAQVEQALERRITDLLGSVAGVGRCQVMVTLDSNEQMVYAADTTRTDTTASDSYLTVDTATGPVGLLLTSIQPTVRGVVVVCAGATDTTVCQRVQAVITTAFHISERRVCVVPQK